MNNFTAKQSSLFRHAVLQMCGQYIDIYYSCETQEDYVGLPSVRIALMSDPDWVIKTSGALLNHALGVRCEPKISVAVPSDDIPVSVDHSLLISRSDFNCMLTNILSKKVDPKTLPKKDSSVRQKDNKEARIQARIAMETGGLTEVTTDYGRIDVLTDSELIEIKKAAQWKSGIGQVLVYGGMYPKHTKRLHLFDVPAGFNMDAVIESCKKFGIALSVDPA